VRLRLDVLNVLANRPGGRATLDEVKREAGAFAPSESQTEQLKRFPEIGEIDIFTSGLVFRDNGFLQITDAGRSLLHSLESANVPMTSPTSPSLQMIDDLIGTDERQRIFDLELRGVDHDSGEGAETDPDQCGQNAERVSVAETPSGMSEPDGTGTNETIDRPVHDESGGGNEPQPSEEDRAIAIETPDDAARNHTAFLQPSFGSGAQDSDRKPPPRLANFFASVAAKAHSVAAIWRGHFEQDTPNPTTERAARSMGAAALAFLSFVALLACAVAAVALVQLKSLKTEIAMLDREVGPLKERLGKLEQAEKTKPAPPPAADQQEGGPLKPGTAQAALDLSREDIQLIREYIKPAPAAGAPTPAINVGDPVSGGTIPLPSPLTDKIPKLLGARFAIRNGAIIIVRRDSHQADAVLAPN
jgi:hypothetical protein